MSESIIEEIAKTARAVSGAVAALSTEQKNRALHAMADALLAQQKTIVGANLLDMEAGEKNGLPKATLDRLLLNEKRIVGMADGLRQIAALPDPVGEITGLRRRPNGLRVGKMRVPLGVVGIIYESRPNVTADTAALCLKSGNAVILRGGSEAINSNRAIAQILSSAGAEAGLPENAIQLVPITDREAVLAMLKREREIDVIIPRGGYGLIRFVTENSLIPVIKHDKGVCHLYVDQAADVAMACKVALNSKAQRPGVCNALETLLVHAGIAENFLPVMAKDFLAAGVELRGCDASRKIVPSMTGATDEDWDAEYLDLILAVKVVADFDEMAAHIAAHGSSHTETIITEHHATAMRFINQIDSSAVMVNASTRFNDGEQFGLGAEIGISTQKLHARGPMGLEELTVQKFIVFGEGHVRE